MMLTLYKAALTLAAPVVAAVFALDPKRRALLTRFRPPRPTLKSSPIWVHACSVGEVNTARPLLEALRRHQPDTELLLTVSTPTGMELAQSAKLPATIAWFPLDHPLVVRRFVRHIQPRALVLVETELWPCVITRVCATGAPVVLVNGRLSDAQAAAYSRYSAFLRPAAAALSAAGMQNTAYAERLKALGTPPDRITITGNTKFDSAPARLVPEERATLRRELGIPAAAPVLVFGSTRPGDEELAAECWRDLSPQFPGLTLIVAPRHLERVGDVQAALQGDGAILRSEIPVQASESTAGRILLLDTHGELGRVYALADIAIVGGSFYPGVDGHNPIEPAAQGVPTVFGPHMRNFQDAANALLQGDGAMEVPSPQTLARELAALLQDLPRREALGTSAHYCIEENQGATERTLELIERTLDAQ